MEGRGLNRGLTVMDPGLQALMMKYEKIHVLPPDQMQAGSIQTPRRRNHRNQCLSARRR